MQQAAEIIKMEPASALLVDYAVITDEAIEVLEKKFTPLEITDGKTYKAVAAAIGEVRGYRVSVEKKRKELKRDALVYGRKVDGEAKRITALLEPIESQLKTKKQIVDDKKAREAAEKAKIEAERINGITGRISKIQQLTIGLNGQSVESLENVLMQVEDERFLLDEYEEFKSAARKTIAETLVVIKEAIAARKKLDDEEAAQKIESERLEKIRAEQAEEARKIAEAKAKIDAENARIEQERQKLETEKAAEANRKEREILEKKLAAEAKVQAEKDAKEKAEREERERVARAKAEAAENARQEALKPDKEKLQNFANYLLNLPPVQVKSEKAKTLANNTLEAIYDVAQGLISSIREM
jgi:colicin import membrane protein